MVETPVLAFTSITKYSSFQFLLPFLLHVHKTCIIDLTMLSQEERYKENCCPEVLLSPCPAKGSTCFFLSSVDKFEVFVRFWDGSPPWVFCKLRSFLEQCTAVLHYRARPLKKCFNALWAWLRLQQNILFHSSILSSWLWSWRKKMSAMERCKWAGGNRYWHFK